MTERHSSVQFCSSSVQFSSVFHCPLSLYLHDIIIKYLKGCNLTLHLCLKKYRQILLSSNAFCRVSRGLVIVVRHDYSVIVKQQLQYFLSREMSLNNPFTYAPPPSQSFNSKPLLLWLRCFHACIDNLHRCKYSGMIGSCLFYGLGMAWMGFCNSNSRITVSSR